MPKYRDPRTGETVELLSDANEVFYLAHGWEVVGDNPVVDFGEAVKASRKSKPEAAPAPTDGESVEAE